MAKLLVDIEEYSKSASDDDARQAFNLISTLCQGFVDVGKACGWHVIEVAAGVTTTVARSTKVLSRCTVPGTYVAPVAQGVEKSAEVVTKGAAVAQGVGESATMVTTVGKVGKETTNVVVKSTVEVGKTATKLSFLGKCLKFGGGGLSVASGAWDFKNGYSRYMNDDEKVTFHQHSCAATVAEYDTSTW